MEKYIFDECMKKHNKEIILTWEELASKYSYPNGEALRSSFKRERKRYKVYTQPEFFKFESQPVGSEDSQSESDPAESYRETIEIQQNGSILSDKLLYIMAEDSKNPQRMMELHGFDPTKWNLISCRNNLWHMQKKGGDRLLCYQSKITVSPKNEPEWTVELVDKLFDSLSKKDFNYNKIKSPDVYNNEILVLPIADFHLGLFSTSETTNNVYNMEIAENRFVDVIDQVINKYHDQQFEECVFIVGNDFMNSDNIEGTTTAGTAQDNSHPWFEIYDKALELLVFGINELSVLGKMKVINVVSNHDNQSMYSIMKALEFYYKDNPNVEIDTSQLPRKYYMFGKVLLGLSHDISIKSALSLMTSEAKHDWSNANKYYWMLAHLHQAMQYEKQGEIEIIRFPTISGWSRWGATKGYTVADKRTQVFIIDKDDGILETTNILVA